MKKFLINLSVTLIATIFGLVAIESFTRFLVGTPSPYPMPHNIEALDKRKFTTLRPGFSGAMDNRIDFVNRPVNIGPYGERLTLCKNQIPNRILNFRIFLLGDSQTFGYGLSDDETWANRMNCKLVEILDQNISVINLGVPGTNVHHYWSRGRKQVVPEVKEGDIVVVSVTWNDLIDFYKGEPWLDHVLAQAGLKRIQHKLLAVQNNRELSLRYEGSTDAFKLDLDHAWSKHKTWRQRAYESTGVLVPDLRSLSAFFNSMTYTSALFRLIASPLKMLYYKMRGSAPMARIKSLTKPRLNAMTLAALQRLINIKGARMLVQILPNRLFFDDYYYRAYSQNGLVFPIQDYTGHIMLPLCEIYQLDCVNRFEVLKTSKRDAHTFAFDGHFNPVGAGKIAEALAKDLVIRLGQ